MNQKGFANIVIVIVGIIVLAGIAGYFIVNQQKPLSAPSPSPAQNPTPTPSPVSKPSAKPVSVSQQDTSKWQTYRDEIWGIEFKYPETWKSAAASPYCLGNNIYSYVSAGSSGTSAATLDQHVEQLLKVYGIDKSNILTREKVTVNGIDGVLVTSSKSGMNGLLTFPYLPPRKSGTYNFYFADIIFRSSEGINGIVKSMKVFTPEPDRIAAEVQSKSGDVRFLGPQNGEKLTKGVPYTIKWSMPKGFTVAALGITRIDVLPGTRTHSSEIFTNPRPRACNTQYSWKVSKITIPADDNTGIGTWEIEPGSYKYVLDVRAYGGTQENSPIYYRIESNIFQIVNP